jgi:hypothetical protein
LLVLTAKGKTEKREPSALNSASVGIRGHNHTPICRELKGGTATMWIHGPGRGTLVVVDYVVLALFWE